MEFSTYNDQNVPNTSNILVIFIDINDPNTFEPLDIIFEEALKLAEKGINVHWFRTRPSYRLPIVKGSPNSIHLSRIQMHYGYNEIYSSIKLFCTKTIYLNSITCSTIFIELHEIDYIFTNSQLVTLLALITNTANYIANKRGINLNQNNNSFPVVLFLRDLIEDQKILVSMYTNQAINWKNKNEWKDLFEWKNFK